jgi:membrane protease YdiL (CAAX protease family)
VTRDNHAAFAWYYRSALLHDHYAEWNVSYMYEMGYGVKPDIGEALQWAKKAQADLPNNDKLKQQVALLNLRAFLESPDTVSLDTSLLATVFHRVTIIGFILSVGFYLILGVMLAFFGFKSPDAPHRLVLAIGWIVFYIESQFVAVLAIFLEGKILTADRLLFMMALWGALPVIIFSFGSNWNRFWKASSLPWRTQVLYIFGSVAAVIAMDIGYNLIYQFIMGSQLTGQSTEALFMKARDSSWWLTLSTLALVMPAAEEILFRGYLFEALKKRFSDPVVLIATSFIFSLVHFQLNYFFLLFGLGFVLGWAKLKSGSLRLSTLLHALNNSLVLVLAN